MRTGGQVHLSVGECQEAGVQRLWIEVVFSSPFLIMGFRLETIFPFFTFPRTSGPMLVPKVGMRQTVTE